MADIDQGVGALAQVMPTKGLLENRGFVFLSGAVVIEAPPGLFRSIVDKAIVVATFSLQAIMHNDGVQIVRALSLLDEGRVNLHCEALELLFKCLYSLLNGCRV